MIVIPYDGMSNRMCLAAGQRLARLLEVSSQTSLVHPFCSPHFGLVGKKGVTEGADRHAKRFRQRVGHSDRRIARAALQIAVIGPVQPRLMRELFLRSAIRIAQPAHVEDQAGADLHCAQRPVMSSIRLQTIRDIRA